MRERRSVFAANDYDGALGFSTDVNADRGFSTTDQTVYFRIDVTSGYALDLQSLEFESLKSRGNNATGSRVTHVVFFDPSGDPAIDGLLGDVDFLAARAHDHFDHGQPQAESTGGDFSTGRWQAGPIDLSSQTGLTGTHTIAIRSYSSDAQDRDFGIDSILLQGTVTAVPEPSGSIIVVLFLVFGATSSFGRHRRIRHGEVGCQR